jgi:hypothetical protein
MKEMELKQKVKEVDVSYNELPEIIWVSGIVFPLT